MMSQKRDKVRERRRRIWEDAKLRELSEARHRIGLGADEVIPDAVLLAEVDHYLPVQTGTWRPNYLLEPRQQWFGFRLMGVAYTEPHRQALARRLRAGPRWGRSPFGLGPDGPARCSPAAARRRNRRRRGLKSE
jgi:hypothetical protein